MSMRTSIAFALMSSFFAATLFGFAFMIHSPDGLAKGDCGTPAMGTAFCPLTGLGAVIHHVSTYQSFVGKHDTSDDPLALTASLAGIVFLSILISAPALAPPRAVVPRIALSERRNEPLGWLARFELSPSRS